MTETQSESTPAAAEDGQVADAAAGGDSDPTLHDLAGRVDRIAGMLEQLLDGGKKAEPERPSIKAEVRQAVRDVMSHEEEKKAEKAEAQSIQDQLTELRHKVETPPAEHVSKRSSRVMGWHVP